MKRSYYIQTFGCQQNVADSERIAAYLQSQGYEKGETISKADCIVVNTCMIREMAENRVYGLIHNLSKIKIRNPKVKLILTGCMVGMAIRDKSGKLLTGLKKKLPIVDEFLPTDEFGFTYKPLRNDSKHAWVPVSSGCNNFCTYCVVPYARGREVSRTFEEIISECRELVGKGFTQVTLLGMNVNSYGSDLIMKQGKKPENRSRKMEKPESRSNYLLSDGREIKPVYVKQMGKLRLPTLFPALLQEVCRITGLEMVDFISSNPWDFSGELIKVIASNPKISREIHLPVQSGSDAVLKRMNRWYTKKEYLRLIRKIKSAIPGVRLSTDIIVGFCGETDEDFQETVDLVKKAGFSKAYIALYSPRPLTVAGRLYKDDVPHPVKKARWSVLEYLINKQIHNKHDS